MRLDELINILQSHRSLLNKTHGEDCDPEVQVWDNRGTDDHTITACGLELHPDGRQMVHVYTKQ